MEIIKPCNIAQSGLPFVGGLSEAVILNWGLNDQQETKNSKISVHKEETGNIPSTGASLQS